MPQPVFSKTFISASHTVGAAALSYTVPAGFVAVIRSVDVVQVDPTKATVCFVGQSQTGSGTNQLFDVDFPTGAATTRLSKHLDCHVAIPAGGTITCTTTGTAAGGNYYTVAGFLLTN